ncbi:MAG: YqeG family HAD IIIA-type phosphatase [Lachnospiraceae bacterium]|nr:YqeG family HAD IIIA-type phosphatase [Lachnospiraceae bacterium]
MFKFLYPSNIKTRSFDIDYEEMYRRGFRGIMFDIDNTLVEHDEPATEASVQLFKRLHEIGFKTCLISNNKDYRVKPFADAMETDYVYKAGKPKKCGYQEGMRKMGTTKKDTFFVGDQIFTDIWGANRAGVYSVLVRPLAKHEEIQIVLKRIIEKPIINSYLRYRSNRRLELAKKR